MRTLALALLLTTTAGAQDSRTLSAEMMAARHRVFPCIVHIVNVEVKFVRGEKKKSVSSGSGFFIDAAGHIVTNYHVASESHTLHVTLSSKRRVRAEYIAGDPSTDLAVLKVDPKKAFPNGGLKFAEFGTSKDLKEGDFVMAMGSPLSLSRSISFGIISCKERMLGTGMRVNGHETGKYNTWLQTDAAINPGNSGGPLVSLAGKVIGVNTRASFMANNIGFAIPVEIVKEVVADLLKHKRVPRTVLGLKLHPLGSLEDTVLGSVREGVLIAAVATNSPAERAQIRPGDFLVKLNGTPFVATFEEELPGLYRRISKLPKDKPALLSVIRDGKSLEIKVAPAGLGAHLGREREIRDWGITVRGITRRMRRDLRLDDGKGVQVTGVVPGSPASGRLSAGDIIRTVQGKAVEDIGGFMVLTAESIRRRDALVRMTLIPGQTSVLDVTALRPDYGKDR